MAERVRSLKPSRTKRKREKAATKKESNRSGDLGSLG
jgi:hypothetical protein